MFNDIKTKICSKCGKELPIDQFRLSSSNGRKYYRGFCKVCEAQYWKKYEAEHQQKVTLPDKKDLLIQRKFKVIRPERILDVSSMGISLVADDEIFVKLMYCKDSWISNYGRMVRKSYGKYILLQAADSNGCAYYSVPQSVYDGEKWTYQRKTIYAAQAVIETFIVNLDCEHNNFIWHKGYEKPDNYYKHLYPMNKEQYYAMRRYYNQTGDDSEEAILQIMNDINYMPDDWSIKGMKPTMYGIGFAGMDKVDRKSVAYVKWHNMMSRCYADSVHKNQPQYIGCTVCEEWHNFQNFKAWFDKWNVEGYELDKDILFKGNTVYSPETCCFVPSTINTLFVNAKERRGDCPVGVYKDAEKNKFRGCFSVGGKRKKLKYWNTPEEAFTEYKTVKEKIIKEYAERYRGQIDEKVYNAMMEWKIEITD